MRLLIALLYLAALLRFDCLAIEQFDADAPDLHLRWRLIEATKAAILPYLHGQHTFRQRASPAASRQK